MAGQNECEYCINPCNGVVRSPLLVRSEALCLYVHLQNQGRLPSMCEDYAGTYRVCYVEKQRVPEAVMQS